MRPFMCRQNSIWQFSAGCHSRHLFRTLNHSRAHNTPTIRWRLNIFCNWFCFVGFNCHFTIEFCAIFVENILQFSQLLRLFTRFEYWCNRLKLVHLSKYSFISILCSIGEFGDFLISQTIRLGLQVLKRLSPFNADYYSFIRIHPTTYFRNVWKKLFLV